MTKFYVDDEGVYIGAYDGAEPPEGAIEVPSAPENAVQKWIDGEWLPYIPSASPHLNGGRLARFSGSAPATVLENIGMSGVTRVAKGRYRVTHTAALPSDQYSVMPSVFDANPRSIRVTARTASYIEVRVIDAAGVAQDATEITVKTESVIS